MYKEGSCMRVVTIRVQAQTLIKRLSNDFFEEYCRAHAMLIGVAVARPLPLDGRQKALCSVCNALATPLVPYGVNLSEKGSRRWKLEEVSWLDEL